MSLDSLEIVAAALTLVWVVAGFAVLRLPSYQVCSIGMLLAGLLAVLLWGLSPWKVLLGMLDGFAFALWPILWVILAALFTYNLAVDTGSIRVISATLATVSSDRTIQALILAFAFGAFLEGVAGFGTAVAIPASIMMSVGFNSFSAALTCLIANTIPVVFAGVGIPIIALAQVADLPLQEVTRAITIQLAPVTLLVPLLIVGIVSRSRQEFKKGVTPALIAGTAFALVQTLVAIYLGPELPAITASLVTLLVVAMYGRMDKKVKVAKSNGAESKEQRADVARVTSNRKEAQLVPLTFGDQIRAWFPYSVLLILILATRLEPHIRSILTVPPFVLSYRLYPGPGGAEGTIDLLYTPGTLMFVAALLGGTVQGVGIKQMATVFAQTFRQLVPTMVTVMTMVAMAKVMGYSGMISMLASATAAAAGTAFPFFAPLVGALGTFLTGTDTGSNVLFGLLQKQTASQLSLNQVWLVAANGSGATGGKMISPQSLAVAAAATGLIGQEGRLFRGALGYALLYSLMMGFYIWIGAWLW